MAETPAWRELHRTSNPQDVLTICTSIAAMEFDVRCVDVHGRVLGSGDFDEVPPPWIIEVRTEDHPALLEVLGEIIAEQKEFDATLDQRDPWTLQRLLLSAVALAGVAIVLWMSFMAR